MSDTVKRLGVNAPIISSSCTKFEVRFLRTDRPMTAYSRSEGFFEGWRDAGSGLLYAAGAQALIKKDRVFIASFRTLADASESYNLDDFLPTVNGALCGFSERSYDEAAATESARVVEKDGDGNVTKVRYAFSLKNGVKKDGVPTLSLTCDEYLVTGWQNSGISLPSPHRTFARTRYVTIPYFYFPVDAGKSSAGRNFTLIVSSGGKNYYANSLEPIKADVWDEAVFDLTELHENAGSNLAVNEDPDTLTEEEKRFLPENILEKAR